MKKAIVLLIAILITTSIHAQIDKGYWLLGGSASYSQHKYNLHNGKLTQSVFTPRVAYFVIDNLAAGLLIDYEINTSYMEGQVSSSKTTQLKAGPFIRYYLLKNKSHLNVFAEGNVSFGKINQKGFDAADIFQFMFAAGPVVYFNSSVALELSIGYRSSEIKFSPVSTKIESILFSVGFNVHLTKD
jgi:hypothetical protein